MKIRFESDDVTLGKILSILSMIIATNSAFQKDKNYYPQICLHECVYEL